MANSSARATILVCRLLSILCFFTACTVVSAQGDSDATPSQAELDHARQLIRETPCPGTPGNPVLVIRSVNCLRALGKTQAIALLFEVASVSNIGRVVSKESDADDSVPVRYGQTINTIVPLLFEVPDHGTLPPDAWYCAKHKKWNGVASTRVLQGDIPFDIAGEWTYGGSPPLTRPLVEWAAENGRLREKPIEPQDDPLLAAAELFNKIAAGDVSIEEWRMFAGGDDLKKLRDSLREQAISMLPLAINDRRKVQWEEVKNIVAQSGVRWDRNSQAYVLTGTGNKR